MIRIVGMETFDSTSRPCDSPAGRRIRAVIRNELVTLRAVALHRSLMRRGASARAIRAKLLQKHLAPALIDQALAGLVEEAREPELAAALTYARRRRLGPYRIGARIEHRERDLAALGRQGFDLDTARRVIDARDLAQLEAEVQSE